jgi:hypothetical protein
VTAARAAGKEMRAMDRRGPIVVAGIALLGVALAAQDAKPRQGGGRQRKPPAATSTSTTR